MDKGHWEGAMGWQDPLWHWPAVWEAGCQEQSF